LRALFDRFFRLASWSCPSLISFTVRAGVRTCRRAERQVFHFLRRILFVISVVIPVVSGSSWYFIGFLEAWAVRPSRVPLTPWRRYAGSQGRKTASDSIRQLNTIG
jgi:hypothetical protein